jgi:hypothetical protein
LANGLPEAEHRTGADQFLVDQLGEHVLGIGVECGGGFPDHLVLQDARELAGQVPGNEERRPVDVLGQHFQIDVIQHFGAGERRFDRCVGAPVELWLFRDRRGIAQAFGAGAAVGGALANLDVILAGFFDEAGLEFLGQQLSRHADRTGRVGDVDHCVVAVLGFDFHRGVRLGGGGATDHQRQVEVLALHLASDVDHFIQ